MKHGALISFRNGPGVQSVERPSLKVRLQHFVGKFMGYHVDVIKTFSSLGEVSAKKVLSLVRKAILACVF